MKVLSNVRHDGFLVWLGPIAQVLYVEKLGNAKVLRGDLERESGAGVRITFGYGVIVEKIRTMPMDQGA